MVSSLITTLPSCISFSLGCFWSQPPVEYYKHLSIVLQESFPSDLIPWIYSSPLLYNHKGFYLGHIRMAYLLYSRKPEVCNKELMIWATVSSRSWFYWLYFPFSIFSCIGYNQSDFSTAHLMMSMCRVISCFWKSVFAMCSVFSWQNLLAFVLLHFVLQNQPCLLLQVLLTSYFCIPIPYYEKDIFFFFF